MHCRRRIRKSCIFYAKMSATFFTLVWITSCLFRVQNSESIAEKHNRVKVIDESMDVYWGEYYRKVIKDLNMEPYKFHMNTSCSARFHDNIENNMKTVLDYPCVRSMKNMYPAIYNDFNKPVIQGNPDEYRFPVILTGGSSNHFTESVRFVYSFQKNLVPRYPGIKLIFFDLGLRSNQRKQIKTLCKCEIRDFPFHDYPRFVSKLTNYIWKPLIIYTMLKEYNFVLWADSSIIFHGSENATDLIFQRAKKVGILVTKLGCECRSFQHTKAETFKHMNETTCLFELFQLEAGFTTVWKTPFTWKYVIQPWLACGLTENCMSHPNPRSIIYCNNKRPYHKCHRFDQSVISIILQRIFNIHYDIITMNRLERIATIKRLS